MLNEQFTKREADANAASPRSGRSAMLPSGITAKMHRFAECVADGYSLADAYRAAFFTANMKDKTVRDEASRLSKNPGVTAVVQAIRREREHQNSMLWRKKEDVIWFSVWALIEDKRTGAGVKVKALTLAAMMAGLV